ncbi:Nicotianamine synthase protein [Paenibacillus sp. 1_12]|uniref:nicotianamine synthase family protein n=1 Tax=Paenibacillus sp. 1_12 TaxID=1566278 RepID=UPI0008ED5AB5|nr:nicotianamine synthase family protein [Paenibacillus sp. 1_12]SFL66497.1 Nicotianamine synthase protein [Paenibacillus sp. 1_12]
MRDKYEFILALKLLDYEIKQLTLFSEECRECFELLRTKLDGLCQFMSLNKNIKLWSVWSQHMEVQEQSVALRETSIKALCNMEKYLSRRIGNHELNISDYIERLSQSVKAELESMQINHQSKVLFIGSGAFPVSALTIAQETGAEVMCLDIDMEAVELGRNTAAMSGLESRVAFTHKRLNELAFSKEATHVIVASLVKNKLEVLDELKQTVHSRVKIMLRYGNGLKSLFNYPLDEDLSGEWSQISLDSKEPIYDTMILERTMQMEGV